MVSYVYYLQQFLFFFILKNQWPNFMEKGMTNDIKMFNGTAT